MLQICLAIIHIFLRLHNLIRCPAVNILPLLAILALLFNIIIVVVVVDSITHSACHLDEIWFVHYLLTQIVFSIVFEADLTLLGTALTVFH